MPFASFADLSRGTASSSSSGSVAGGSTVGRRLGSYQPSSNLRGLDNILNQQSSANPSPANTATAPQGTREARRAATKAAAKTQGKASRAAGKGKANDPSTYGHGIGKPRCSVTKCSAAVTLAGYCETCSRSFCSGHARVHVCQKKDEGVDSVKQDGTTSTGSPSDNALSTSGDTSSSET